MRSGGHTKRVLSGRNLWTCWWNVVVVVLSLLAVWFNILVEYDLWASVVCDNFQASQRHRDGG